MFSKGFIYVLVSAICFATNAVWIKLAYGAQMTLWQLLTLQSVISSIFLVLATAIFQPQAFRVARRQLAQISLQGIVGFLLTGILFTAALQYISAALTTVILYTYPALVAIFSALLLKKGFSLRHFLAVLLTLLGTVMAVNIFAPDAIGSIHWLGVALALGSALTYTFFNIYSEVIMTDVSPLSVSVYGQLTSTVVLLSFTTPWKLFPQGVSWDMFYLTFLLATVASVVPFFLVLKGIDIIGADKASVISTFELPATLFFAYFILREQILSVQLIGTALILTGIFVVKLPKKAVAQ